MSVRGRESGFEGEMMYQRMLQREKSGTIASVGVVVDEQKWSQNALKWAADHVISRGQMVALIHVIPTSSPLPVTVEGIDDESNGEEHNQNDDFFLPFRVFCSTRDVPCELITLHDNDIAKAIIEYVALNRMETLVLGSPSKKKSISRFFGKTHVASNVSKGVPDFCSVYVISKGKINSMRSANRQLHSVLSSERLPYSSGDTNGSKHYTSVLPRCRTVDSRGQDEYSLTSSSMSLASSGRLSTDIMAFAFYDDNLGSQEQSQRARRCLSVRKNDFEPFYSESKLNQFNQTDDDLSSSDEESKTKSSSVPESIERMEEKMRRLELQMKQTMEMYHAACREALIEKQKAKDLLRFRKDEENRLREEERAKEEALAIAEMERAKCKEAIEIANSAQRISKKEAKMRKIAERRAIVKEAEVKMMLEALNSCQSPSAVVPRNQSLINILVVLFVFYLYSATQKCIFM